RAERKKRASKSGGVAVMGGSGRQAHARPGGVVFPLEDQPVVKARRPSLPEFDIIGCQAITAPVLGAWRFGSQRFGQRKLASFELFAGDGLALGRHPRAYARTERPALEISIRVGGW